MENNINKIVKEALLDEVKEISDTEDIFCRIEEEIKTGSGNGSADRKHFNAGFGFKRYFSVAACLLLVLSTLAFASSAQVRALAVQAVESIKTIFVVEKVDDKLQIVERPVNEVFDIPIVSRGTEKSDEEIGIKLGYKVSFPEALCDSLKLDNKSTGVELNKLLDYEASQKVKMDMFDAIEDDGALNSLKPYGATRSACGAYVKPDQSKIFVDISKTWTMAEVEKQFGDREIEKVKIGELDGLWIKGTVPDYPTKVENGIGKADMSDKPGLTEHSLLVWEKAGILYRINTIIGNRLTLEEAQKIAEDFMKYN